MPLPPDNFNPPVGQAIQLSRGLRRILAPNPSPMTYRGTNTYLVGERDIAVIDPGPLSESHLDAILSALLPSQRISHIIVTHTHLDHSPLAKPLSERCGAPIYAFGGPESGRSEIMQRLVQNGLRSGGEGIDLAFRPDIEVEDKDLIEGEDWAFEVIHTPGHLGNHIALGWGELCFTADHVMGWASSLVSPPDGDLTDFMQACQDLRARPWSVFHPGHGAPVTDPAARIDWLIQHRLSRETGILRALEDGHATAHDLAKRIYTETPASLLGAAERNVFAHLIDLSNRSLVVPTQELSETSEFNLLA
ncbi:MBL fold metallo-hydrolase [Phaeobacter gallaeciensis]|uniref:MBL fold metallo-hydrolase n=2 Tax=Roseobacteraceae TaxID=2854170 RepID=A0A366WT64_9RHOB|nr:MULTISPECIES: MBL fold metallo-hydrolase [Roseobacteraceae]MBT3140400.1 MBL fold metallo-hydrolase [Falsiruegeria litorea]MBT8171185.1 MBL fold metallo-hydrolase [Falsiruegeria litorea]RBW51719.1 MBL fold metallo-hydrolase [Phaeobacter gallaeciensis]